MTMKRALEWILGIAVFGMSFSGYLSYLLNERRRTRGVSPPARFSAARDA